MGGYSRKRRGESRLRSTIEDIGDSAGGVAVAGAVDLSSDFHYHKTVRQALDNRAFGTQSIKAIERPQPCLASFSSFAAQVFLKDEFLVTASFFGGLEFCWFSFFAFNFCKKTHYCLLWPETPHDDSSW